MAAAPALQRSVDTFRRSGSSGQVWEDRFLISEEEYLTTSMTSSKEARADQLMRELRPSHSVGTSIGQTQYYRRSRTPTNMHINAAGRSSNSNSNSKGGGGGGGGHLYRSTTVVVSHPSIDPPSPKLPVCGFFGLLGNSGTKKASSKSAGSRR